MFDINSMVVWPIVLQHAVTSLLLFRPPSHLRLSFRCRVRTACCCSSQPGLSRRSSATPSTPSVSSITCHTSSNGQGRNSCLMVKWKTGLVSPTDDGCFFCHFHSCLYRCIYRRVYIRISYHCLSLMESVSLPLFLAKCKAFQ